MKRQQGANVPKELDHHASFQLGALSTASSTKTAIQFTEVAPIKSRFRGKHVCYQTLNSARSYVVEVPCSCLHSAVHVTSVQDRQLLVPAALQQRERGRERERVRERESESQTRNLYTHPHTHRGTLCASASDHMQRLHKGLTPDHHPEGFVLKMQAVLQRCCQGKIMHLTG